MAVVESVDGDPNLFRIILPQSPTARQTALKERIESLLAKLRQRDGDPGLVARLRRIAELGFDGLDGATADPDAAMTAAQALANEITTPPHPGSTQTGAAEGRCGAFRVALPTPSYAGGGAEWLQSP
jgi:hypothetical protein